VTGADIAADVVKRQTKHVRPVGVRSAAAGDDMIGAGPWLTECAHFLTFTRS